MIRNSIILRVGVPGACALLAAFCSAQHGATLPDTRSFTTFPLADAPSREDLRDAPVSVDLSGTVPEPGDQGFTNTCTGWAVGYGTCSSISATLRNDTLLHHQAVPPPDRVFSPSFIYALALGNGKCNDNVRLSQALRMAVDSGCCTWSDFPFDTIQVDLDCHTVPAMARSNAPRFRLGGVTALPPYSPDAMRQQLAAGNLVVISAGVEQHFIDSGAAAAGVKPFTWRPVDFKNIRSHAMLCMGYNDADQTFLVQNSWGLQWGYRGTFRMPYAVAGKYVTEAYAVAPAARALELLPPPVVSDTALHDERNLTAELSEGEHVRHLELDLLATDISSGSDSLVMLVQDDDTGAPVHTLVVREDQPHTIYHEGVAYRITFTDGVDGGKAARVHISTEPQEQDDGLRRALKHVARFDP